MNYFKRFGNLEKNENEVPTIEGPKVTAILTYEQVLFYSIPPERLAEYKQLEQEIGSSKQKMDENGDELNALLRQNPRFSDLLEREENVDRIRWDFNKPEEERKKAEETEKRIREEISELKNKITSTGRGKKLEEEKENNLQTWEKKREQKESLYMISANSPKENLLTYGLLDYTSDRGFDTKDNKHVRTCISYLTDELLRELDDYDKDAISQIILFSGLHGDENPYYAGMRIQDLLELEQGIVQVYSTMSAPPPNDCGVEVLRKERDDICDVIKQMNLPEEVVDVHIPPIITGQGIQNILQESSR